MFKENIKQVEKENTVENIIPLKGGRYLYLCAYNQVINSCVKDLFLKHEAERKIIVYDVNVDEKKAAKKVRKLATVAIEMTENCNLRCRYCVFSDHYNYRRNRTPRQMKFDIARKGMDYIYSLIKDRRVKEFSIGFYGGEPLLNFAAIKKITAHSRELFDGWNLHFNITTNLTLLDDENLDFMAANDFAILVSLDGGRESHDCKRVFADGQGSFDAVYRNLDKILKRYPQFYEKIGFSGVFSPDLSLKKMHEFFSNNELVKDRRVRYSLVSPCTDSYFKLYQPDWGKYRREYEEVQSCILEKLRNKQELTGYETFLFNETRKLRQSLNIRSDTTMAGACLFDSRLFLDVSGRFHICERINNTFSIGDVENGFDFRKMASIAHEYAEFTENHCSTCKVRFLCNRCYAQFADDGRFKFEPVFCRSQQASIIRSLERYIDYKEEGLL